MPFYQVLTVVVVGHLFAEGEQARGVNPAHAESNLFEHSHLEALAVFDCLNKVGRLHERVDCAGVEPGESAAEALYI